MDTVKNLIVICQWQDGSYKCTVDMYDTWNQVWEENILYVARRGDPAPVNVWIIEQIDTGAYAPISACPIPPAPLPPSEVSGDNGPTVA
jgi:hypothetical protein